MVVEYLTWNSYFKASEVTDEDRDFAEGIIYLINDFINSIGGEIVRNEELFFDDHPERECEDSEDDVDDDDSASDKENSPTRSASSYDECSPGSSKQSHRIISDEQLQQALDFYRSTANDRRSFKVMRHRFHWINTKNDLCLIKK